MFFLLAGEPLAKKSMGTDAKAQTGPQMEPKTKDEKWDLPLIITFLAWISQDGVGVHEVVDPRGERTSGMLSALKPKNEASERSKFLAAWKKGEVYNPR